MFWKRRKTPPKDPPQGLGRRHIATQSSICTGETLIGFQDPGSGRLLQAVIVRSEEDIRAFYHAYGYPAPGETDDLETSTRI
ncbi:MAG: hypothetical protein U0L91_08790 [Gemmiger sp.]|uniref:hypothetical protein n=1 Tax=Gemmiger sp. TaxID=2049027 RepID=UPI002E7A0AF8|nr:hypothetical protein [Gemmiger sp.]MEE0801358.1 hypothetical protein [Gemmiger sp.]